MGFRDANTCAYFNSVDVDCGQLTGTSIWREALEDAIDTDQLRECLAEYVTKSNSWVLDKTTDADAADFLEARLEGHDHIVCGESQGI